MRKPMFRSDLQVRIIPPDLLAFSGESGKAAGLKGRLLPLLAPLIDGIRTVEEIAELLADHNILDLHYAMILLEEEGYITEADDSRTPGHRGIGDSLGLDPRVHQQRLGETTIQITACGPVATAPLAEMLDRLQLRRGDDGDLAVVVADDYLRQDLEAINLQALQAERSWMLIKPVGAVLWIGPIFTPGQSACWNCLAERLRQNRPLDVFAAMHGALPAGAVSTPRATLDSASQAAYALAATEILRWAVDVESSSLVGHLLTVDLRGAAMHRHQVVRLPHCAACSVEAAEDICVPLALRAGQRQPQVDGGYRSVTPGQTLDRLAHHVSALTGIVDEIRPLREDDLIQVYSAGFAFAPGLKDRRFLEQGLRNQATGKGMSREQARASALCEALERYSGVHTGRESRRFARYQDLGDAAIHPNEFMLFSPMQYERRQEMNRTGSSWIPEPFDQSQEVDWSPLWSLSHEVVRHLPTACCYYGCPCPPGHDFGRADSNGSAAGNTMEEAILQGFMEVVERDAVALWWYNRLRRPGVDLASFEHPYLAAVEQYYRRRDLRLWVLDLTTDFAIPVFAALSIPDAEHEFKGDAGADNLLLGFGAHFDPAIAMTRAVTELNQLLPSALRGKLRRVVHASLEETDFLRPDASLRPRTRAAYSCRQHHDLGQAVAACVALAGERGLEVLVLDQSRPEVGLPVVKVVIPGMRPMWPRFAPGRLYSVPVELGWLNVPAPEEELNPAHLAI